MAIPVYNFKLWDDPLLPWHAALYSDTKKADFAVSAGIGPTVTADSHCGSISRAGRVSLLRTL